VSLDPSLIIAFAVLRNYDCRTEAFCVASTPYTLNWPLRTCFLSPRIFSFDLPSTSSAACTRFRCHWLLHFQLRYLLHPFVSLRCRPPASYRIVRPSMSSASLNQYLSLYTWSPGVAPSEEGSRPRRQNKNNKNNKNKNQQKKTKKNHSKQPRRSENAVARCTAIVYKAKYLLQMSKGSAERGYY
jgi:hypothetical protein